MAPYPSCTCPETSPGWASSTRDRSHGQRDSPMILTQKTLLSISKYINLSSLPILVHTCIILLSLCCICVVAWHPLKRLDPTLNNLFISSFRNEKPFISLVLIPVLHSPHRELTQMIAEEMQEAESNIASREVRGLPDVLGRKRISLKNRTKNVLRPLPKVSFCL